jgi:hypothetical protein
VEGLRKTFPIGKKGESAVSTKTEHRVTIRFTESEVEALGYALDLAYDDQSAYFDFGNPKQDYGAEWPEVSKRKEEQFRAIAQIGFRVGLAGELERWNTLADAVLQWGSEVQS